MLHFSPTPASLWIGIAALILAASLSFLAIKRSPRRNRTITLEALRLIAVTAVVIMLWQPEWQKTLHPTSKPQIVILHDASKSMETIDASIPATPGSEAKVISRAELSSTTLASDLWNPLAANGKNEVLRNPFAKAAPDTVAGTDINAALGDTLKNHDNLRAVIMLSDGDHNLGQPPVAAAQKLRVRGIPLFAMPIGSTQRMPDIDILTVAAPSYGIVGENVQIPFTIRSSLDREVRTVIRMRDEKGNEQSKSIVIPPNAETYDSLLWRIRKEGTSTLELSLPVHERERIATNNTRKFSITGRPEKIRVLVVESLPRWEYRFLRNALSRDPGVELSCLLFHPILGPGGGNHYISSFPSKPEDLAPYDVIFLGDVGIGNNQLTKEQCTLIRGLVENQASGVVFLPGSRGNQFSLLDTELADLMPVVLDDTQRNGIRDPLAAPLTLTSEGRSSLLTLLGENEEENPEIWRQLPGFHWHAPVIKAKAGAEVLAVHGNSRSKFGAAPLLVTKSAGNGKVLFMGIDSAWRWRRGVEDLYHYRFWGQVARWMSYQRNMATGKRVRVFFNPERPQPGDTVTLNANAFELDGSPLRDGGVSVDLTSPDGRSQRLSLEKLESTWGSFSGRFKVDQPGTWKLRVTNHNDESNPLETSLIAQGSEIEKTGQPARPEVLEEITRITRGRIIQPDQIPSLINEIKALPQPRPIISRTPLWSHWVTLVALVTLLATFWIARKLSGQF
ncbi:MAG: hypothetical protein B9S30_00445 [Verrucomicrobiia bacterium Tous-C5FEB]|nr:MAG: hypothetical protein B9S30_00445 [Verrucomicrobiae bacterium Tous-C5FEB]